ncbi:MAG: hypothetical protein ACLR9F_02955, partial [Faecalibacterium prausnitzii]
RKKNIPRATSARTSLKKNQLCLWPARSASHLTAREKTAPRHRRENQLKEKTALPLARAERKPFDRKKKPAPRIGARYT